MHRILFSFNLRIFAYLFVYLFYFIEIGIVLQISALRSKFFFYATFYRFKFFFFAYSTLLLICNILYINWDLTNKIEIFFFLSFFIIINEIQYLYCALYLIHIYCLFFIKLNSKIDSLIYLCSIRPIFRSSSKKWIKIKNFAYKYDHIYQRQIINSISKNFLTKYLRAVVAKAANKPFYQS